MARIARQNGESGYYHIMMRGIDRQDIFFEEEDYARFLETVRRFQDELKLELGAYCLMTNHIHMLVRVEGGPGEFVKKIASSYVYYFNHKYDRIGHLFQERYNSEPVDTDAYLLTVTRYIMRNPEKAGICKAADYPWSSWKEIRFRDICNMEMVIELVGGEDELEAYIGVDNDDSCLDIVNRGLITDAEAKQILQKIAGVENPLEVAGFPKAERNRLLVNLKEAGLSVRQISRLSGINRNTVQRAR